MSVLCAALIAGCGGGSGTVASDVADASGTSSSSSSTTASSAAITLTNLPDKKTASVTAAIGYELGSAATSSTVYCRLDSYAPIVCPDTFLLGQIQGLAAGTHTVDYYVDTGSGIDVSKPDDSYTWVVSATASSDTSIASPDTGSSTSSTATALANLPYPVPTDLAGTSSPSVSSTSTVTGSDGIARLTPVADPGGSGQQVYLHRIVRNDGNMSGSSVGTSVRAEKVWIDENKYMFAGTDYWFAFAFRPKAGEWPAYSGMSDDDFLVMQTHSESNGDTQPPIALFVQTGQQAMRWRSSYSAASQATSPQGVSVLNSQGLPSTEVWYKYIVHMRPGYLASQSPRTEVWMATGSSAYTKIVDSTAVIDYNWSTGSYPRIGFYKWAGTGWSSSYPTIAAYFTSLYMETGTNKYDNAVASLAALK